MGVSFAEQALDVKKNRLSRTKWAVTRFILPHIPWESPYSVFKWRILMIMCIWKLRKYLGSSAFDEMGV